MTPIVISRGAFDSDLEPRLHQVLSHLGGMENVVKPGSKVIIKPNFVAPFAHAVTDFRLLSSIVKSVRSCGAEPMICESSGFEFDTGATFKILGAYELGRRLDVPVINLDLLPKTKIVLRGTRKKVEIPRIVLESDHLINVPKLKRHSITRATIGVKNLFGLLSRESRRAIHAWGLEKSIYHLGLTIRTDLVIVDASVVTERAVYGKRSNLNLLVASKDVHATDIYCCQHLGIDYKNVEHIRRAAEQYPHSKDYKVIHGNISVGSEETVSPQLGPITEWNDSNRDKFHRLMYQMMYFVDMAYTRLTHQASLIPKAHYYVGIRPHLDQGRCTACGDCIPVCPVNAIRMPARTIDAHQCMRVRCLQCISTCPENALSVKGREVDPTFNNATQINA